jgi:hypothetical protein
MLNVSSDFKTAISAPYRVIRGRCTLAYDYPFIESTITSYNASNENANSSRAKLADGIALSDYYNNGVFRGYQSSTSGNGSGVFSGMDIPFVRINFNAPRTVNYLQVVGDNVTGQYPVDFTIRYYNNTLGTISDTVVTNNALMKYETTTSVASVLYVGLFVTKWSAPSTTAKITSFTIRKTETFTGDDIIKMDITEEIEPEGGTIFGTAIAKKAEVTLSNFADKFTNVQFLANRTFYPEYGVDLTLVGLDDTFGINTAVDLEVEQDFTVATNTTWELEADKDLTVEDVSEGDYELIDNQMFADFDALPQRMEWCPMGIYYTNDWKLSDDRYSLSIQGLDAIGYLTTQTYTNAMTTNSSFDLQAYLDALLASVLSTYTTETVYESDIDTEVNFKLISALKTKINTFNLREYLNNLSLTGIVAKSAAFPVLTEKVGLSYMQSSRWENKILLIGKFSTPKAIDQYTNFIADYNSFKLKNYRNDKNMINTFRVETLEGVVQNISVAERVAIEGIYAETVPDTNFITSDSYATVSTYYLPKLNSVQQSECNAEWQGNPAWELGDDVSVQIPRRGTQSAQAELNQGYIVANHFKYSGGLRCTTRTKILRTDEVAG